MSVPILRVNEIFSGTKDFIYWYTEVDETCILICYAKRISSSWKQHRKINFYRLALSIISLHSLTNPHCVQRWLSVLILSINQYILFDLCCKAFFLFCVIYSSRFKIIILEWCQSTVHIHQIYEVNFQRKAEIQTWYYGNRDVGHGSCCSKINAELLYRINWNKISGMFHLLGLQLP